MATKDQAISGCRVISRKSPVTFEYEALTRSELLPGLDIEFLAECVRHANPLIATREFRKRLREQFS
jgi:hypothetical protein